MYKGNSHGALKHPVGVCIASHGTILVSDKTKSCLFSVRLHYPCDVTEVSKSLQEPHDVIYMSGVTSQTLETKGLHISLKTGTFLQPERVKGSKIEGRVAKARNCKSEEFTATGLQESHD